MKKQFLVIVALIVACFVSWSCGKDGEAGGRKLVGTWVVVEEVDTMSDGTVNTYKDKSDWSKDSPSYYEMQFQYMIIFYDDGTWTQRLTLEDNDKTRLGFSIKNGYILGPVGTRFAKIVSNNGKTLVLEQAEENLRGDDCVKSVATYKKQ